MAALLAAPGHSPRSLGLQKRAKYGVSQRMIIEFTGPSGSGKSTLASLAREQLAARGREVPLAGDMIRSYIYRHSRLGGIVRLIPTTPRARVLWYFYRFYYAKVLLGAFEEGYQDAWVAFRSGLTRLSYTNPGDHTRVKAWVEEVASEYMLLREALPDTATFLWEEGIAHRAINLFANTSSGVEVDQLRRFVASWPFPDAIVEVAAAAEVCLHRILRRGLSSRLLGKADQEIIAFLRNSETVVHEIVEEAKKRNVKILRFANNRGSLGALTRSEAWAELMNEIESLRVAR